MGPSAPNPYEPPASVELAPAAPLTPAADASRWSRLWAGLIDGLLNVSIAMPLPLVLSHYVDELQITELQFGLIATLSRPVVWLALNGFLLARSAQTIGKKLLRIQVVNASDGEPASFLRLVAWRFLPLVLISQVPYGKYLGFVEILVIFRPDRRCVHDHIAGTRVVNLMRSPAERRPQPDV